MKACQYVEIGAAPKVTDIPKPEPGPGQVLLKVSAAGACHSDEFIMSLPAEQYAYGLPLTLGHEGAGEIAELGDGVEGWELGESVAVYGPWGCGTCHACAQGKENYCRYAAERNIRPPGLGNPGAMAEYMIVNDQRHLVRLGDLDPVQNVALTDAGLTPYHAIRTSLPKLLPGRVAVVIGAGGLGHMAVQILKALTAATVVALDLKEDARQLALDVGADYALPSERASVDEIRKISGGLGATAVFDCVGADATLALAGKMVHEEADIAVVGLGGGSLPVGFLFPPHETRVWSPYWGSRSELEEVLDLARLGAIHVETESFTLDEAPTVYERMHAGTLRGRGIVVP
ncbi:NAD(P)-dependent alcohol dehydrogenase [Cumulibacter soli]|uniref:NAD(P)-dependent alcohol dehydrogenase n=1 Tax=Cumulibacter soli TaxID=2546344 RepID=UPI0010686DFB|nr:NAD(P)-dependent alcohol dehydrogenase [Cumulibacter soli]